MSGIDVVKEYEAVNSALKWVGQDPISVPSGGTDRQKIEFLLNTYAERLRRAVPTLENCKDNRLLPDLVVQHLVAVLGGKE